MLINESLVLTTLALSLFLKVAHYISIQSNVDIDLDLRERDIVLAINTRMRNFAKAASHFLVYSLFHILSVPDAAPEPRSGGFYHGARYTLPSLSVHYGAFLSASVVAHLERSEQGLLSRFRSDQ